jgi:hypothetical protein
MSTTTQSITPSQNTVSYSTLNTDLQSGGYASNFKNRIINGAMVIDQRRAGASFTVPQFGGYSLDRWNTNATQASKFSVQQDAGSVTPPVGFNDYLGVTSLSAYSVLSTDFFSIVQSIEGFNTADLGWGTANAQTVTVSFWVRSSLTGTFGGSLNNSNFTRAYPFTYTISAANTWEQKSITVAGDTTGTWLANNSTGIHLYFNLGAGSSFSGTAGAWAASGVVSATGATSVVGTNGATFYITGVQLEKGSTATSFDYRPYGTEFSLCQRYYYRYIGASGNNYEMIGTGVVTNATQADVGCPLPVPMRTVPSCAFTGTIFGYDQGTAQILSSIGAIYGGKSNIYLNLIFTNSGGFSAGRGFIFYTQNASTASFAFSAEL